VFFASYEAFLHIIDSMVNQHAKWLEKCKTEVKWRASIPSLNLLITSTVWRQDNNGFTHQDRRFLDVVTNKSSRLTMAYSTACCQHFSHRVEPCGKVLRHAMSLMQQLGCIVGQPHLAVRVFPRQGF
jgi:hypothetical protein